MFSVLDEKWRRLVGLRFDVFELCEGRSCLYLSNGRHFYNSYRFLFISHAFKPNATALLELLRRKLLIWRRSEWWGCPKYDTTLLYTSPALMKIDWQKAERSATEGRRLVKKDSQSSAFKRKVKDNKRCILTVISCQIICAYLNANHRRGFRRFAFDVTYGRSAAPSCETKPKYCLDFVNFPLFDVSRFISSDASGLFVIILQIWLKFDSE